MRDTISEFQLTPAQERWASKRRQSVSPSRLRQILLTQLGLCAFSGAPLVFDVQEGTPQSNGPGCHPLYPAVDHVDPGNPCGGFQIVCYALNDLKGHLPMDCFEALRATAAWKTLMVAWKEQAATDYMDRKALMRLLRPNAKPRKKPQGTPNKFLQMTSAAISALGDVVSVQAASAPELQCSTGAIPPS